MFDPELEFCMFLVIWWEEFGPLRWSPPPDPPLNGDEEGLKRPPPDPWGGWYVAKAAGSIQFLDFTTTSKNLLKGSGRASRFGGRLFGCVVCCYCSGCCWFSSTIPSRSRLYGASSRWNESAEYQPKQPKFLRQENQNKEASSSGKRRKIQNVKKLCQLLNKILSNTAERVIQIELRTQLSVSKLRKNHKNRQQTSSKIKKVLENGEL